MDDLLTTLATANSIRADNDCDGDFTLDMVMEFAVLNETTKINKAIANSKLEVL
jgi:hypothetical protein